MQGDIREASEVYKQGGAVIDRESPRALTRRKVIDADPSNTDAKMKLAELYEIMDEPRKALELVYQGTHFDSITICNVCDTPHSY